MRVIALEEHYRAPALAGRVPETRAARPVAQLDEIGAARLADMDHAGIDVQVLSHTVPATEVLPGEEAVTLAAAVNDYLADVIAEHPERYAGFATLPMGAPAAAADELERAVASLGLKGAMVNGLTDGRFLDDPRLRPVLQRAERLGVPLYLHPAEPPPAVLDAYYSDLPAQAAQMLATAGWGWHVDTGLHALRLVLGGVFDELPGLQIIIGHMGEALPFLLARSSRILTAAANLPKPLEHYFAEHFHFTTSGLFTYPPLQCLLSVIGVERVMFSVDYPYSSNAEGVEFLRGAPVSDADRAAIAHLNAERLLRL